MLTPMLHQDRARALSFGSDPDRYHRTRPTYPASLVEHLLADGAVEVVDVGCGTGIAASLLVERGCRVVGVEPDERMAAYARGIGFDVESAAFEEWDPAGRSFDLVTSGQAWHWVDPRRGAAKAAGVLRPGGRIGLFWNRARHPARIQETFDSIYRREAPGLDGYSIVLGHGTGDRFEVAAAGLESAGGFGPVERAVFPWEATYTTARWIDHLVTHSDHRALPADQRRRLLDAIAAAIDGLGGSFTTGYETVLVGARRR